MPLKTLVKVGNISNLSDARYCSGMGVDLLGFAVIPGHPDYIAPKLFQEIRGWISGPKTVAEIYGIKSVDELPAIIENYAPDYFEMSVKEYESFADKLTLPAIVSVTGSAPSAFKDKTPAFLLIEEKELNLLTSTHYPLIVKVASAENVTEMLTNSAIKGIALNGSKEVRPGFKDYHTLADILEMLED